MSWTEEDSTMASDTDQPGTAPARKAQHRSARASTRVEHFTPDERAARGKATRAEVPRTSHGAWEPALHRPDPVELLEEQAQTRVPELVPIRYGRMLVSPFTFYRGAAYLMASDLAAGPRTGLHTQLCGDAHLSNFGGFAAPDRKLVFSLNDFDETLPGPFEWDVKRLAASFAVAGRDRGFDEKQRAVINQEVGRSYRENIREFAAMRNLDIWYSRIDVDDLIARVRQEALGKDAKAEKRLEANVAKGRTKDSIKAFSKLTTIVDGEPRITGDPPLIVPIEDVYAEHVDQMEEFLRGVDPVVPAHARRRPAQAARAVPLRARGPQGRRRRQRRHARLDLPHARPRRPGPAVPPVQGGAAVGARAVPRSQRVREQRPAGRRGPAAHAGGKRHHARLDQGRRARRRQARLLHPPALGREDVGAWSSSWSRAAMGVYAHVCGRELARAHARAGDGIAIASYLGNGDTFDRAIAQFAETYADQNERDYAALKTAVEVGRVHAEFGL